MPAQKPTATPVRTSEQALRRAIVRVGQISALAVEQAGLVLEYASLVRAAASVSATRRETALHGGLTLEGYLQRCDSFEREVYRRRARKAGAA
jgi:hypothetical protein